MTGDVFGSFCHILNFCVTDGTCVLLLFMAELNVVIHFDKVYFFIFFSHQCRDILFLCMEYSEGVLLICKMVLCDIFSYSCVLLVL